MFGESDIYRQINNNANGVRPSNVRAPSLTWYMAFFVPNNVQFSEVGSAFLEENIDENYVKLSDNKIVDHAKDRKFFKKRIDQFFIELCRGIRKQEFGNKLDISPEFDGKYILFQNLYDKISLRSIDIENYAHDEKENVLNLKKVLREVISNDYRSITANFVYKGMPTQISCDLYGEYCSFSIIVELESLNIHNNDFHLRSNFISLIDSVNGKCDCDMKTLSDFFYRIFWQDFSQYLAACCDMDITTNTVAFKHIFADFRGVVLPIDEDRRNSFSEKLSLNFNEKPEVQFHSNKIWNGFLDFVTNRDEFECTACHMLNGRVLYMSDLAQRRTVISIDRVPVTYLLCAKTENAEDSKERRLTVKKWELGRLVDDLHQLGTLRLGALRDLNHIRNSSRALANLAAMMKQASDDERSDRISDVKHSQNSEKGLSIRKARDYFNSINSKYIESDDSQQGLQYRIERSRFYVNQFTDKVKTLQIKEIEGYQRYDNFVFGRMGTIFDFIDRVGRGYERAGSSLSLLEQAYLAENLNDATQKLAKLAEKSDRTSKNLENLQEWADLALIGFLIPYYAYALLNYLASDLACSIKGYAVFGWFVAYAVGAFRFSGLTRCIDREKILIFVVLVGGAILVTVGFLIASDKFIIFIDDPIGWLESMGKFCVKH